MPVYLDHAASGLLHPAAAAAVQEWMARGYGNPSGSHSVARRAKAALEEARDTVAAFLGVEPGGVVFTSGGTEADNLAVLGSLAAHPGHGSSVAVSAVEHPAVTESALAAGSAGREVRTIGVGPDGLIDLDGMRRLLDRDVALVSVQTANHETGVVQPLDQIIPRVRKWAPGAVFHTDAVQAAAWMDLPAVTLGADLLSISGHKIGGPQGIGALAVRNGTAVAPVIHGGGQERERRSGTPNVAAIAGLAAAVEETTRHRQAYSVQVEERRDLLSSLILAGVPDAVATAPESPKLPGHCHFRFRGVESEALLFLLDERGVCASAGAACASGAIEPSPVLLAMGVEKDEAGSALRLTLGPTTTEEDVRIAAAAVVNSVNLLRGS
ncbi:MAG TPA: cysteine desulfurase family protein [Acidimicrobiales bacterium]|nr:cysteine desulfurase family protein [Acidimicrobiales bacterium]